MASDEHRRPFSGSRTWATAKVAWAASRTAARQMMGRTDPQTDRALGKVLTEQLDSMKGLAMKVGQIVSYMDVPLPGEVQRAMAALQTGATAMAPAQVRTIIEEAFDTPLETLFDTFEDEPIAAASVGQVHRARVRGQAVAVKVQYPGVVETLRSDVCRMRKLSSLASLATAVDGPALVDELRDRMVEECDYEREARSQRAFRAAFDGEPGICIPGVIEDRCRASVLTTDWAEGIDFEQLRTAADEARRGEVAKTLVHFAYRSMFTLAALQADPHPGNYLFATDGSVVFLDFGCVRRLEIAMVEALRDLTRAVLERRDRQFADAAVRLGVVGKRDGFDFEHFFGVMEHLYRPFAMPRFRFDTEYVRAGYALNGATNPNARRMAIPPAFIWVQRLQWGLNSVLARLQAEGDFRDVFRACLDAPLAPLGDPSSPRTSARLAV